MPTLPTGPADTNTVEPDAIPEAPSEPAPDLQCPYGCGSLEKCAEYKASRYDIWETIHGRDPEVIEKRRVYNTKVTLRMLPFGHPRY